MSTKIGLHLHSRSGLQLANEWATKLRPTVLKVLTDDMEALRPTMAAARQAGAVVIGRLWWPEQTPGQHAAFLGALKGWATRFPEVEFWEGYNECFQEDDAQLRERSKLDLELIAAMESIGRKAVIGSFSVGQPAAAASWRAYAPAIIAAAGGGHLLGLHEYGGPAMQWGVGGNQVSALVDDHWVAIDPVTRPDVDGWFCLRYRKVFAILRSWNLPALPDFVITEAGLDDIQPRPNVGTRRGYKSYQGTPYWAHPLLGDFAAQMAWYEARLREDDYVRGAVIFGVGDASGKWDDFDIATDPATNQRLLSLLGRPVSPAVATGPGSPSQGATMSYRTLPLPSEHWSPRGAMRPRYLVLHSTASASGSSAEATGRYLQKNARLVSAHYCVGDGVAYALVSEEKAAHHCGSSSARMPDGTAGSALLDGVSVSLPNAVSIGVELFQVVGQNTRPEVIATGASVVADIMRRNPAITLERIVAHRDVDPARRSDPVGVDMRAFRAAVAAILGQPSATPPLPHKAPDGLAAAAIGSICLALNAEAALYKAIRSAGYIHVGPERDFGTDVVYQVARPAQGGAPACFWCRRGAWGAVYKLVLPG